MYLPTVREIRASAATMRGLHPPTLERVILGLANDWRSGGRGAEAQLLDYVKTLITPSLPGRAPESSAITDTQSLLAFLLRAPNALRMRTALAAHHRLVNKDLLAAARAELDNARKSSPSKELCLAMYLIAWRIDDREGVIIGLLMWGSFCREHRALWQAERHFRRAAQLAKEFGDPKTRLMILGAQAGLYRATKQYRDACAALEEGLQLAAREDTALVASFAQGLASCYRALGETAKALDAANRLVSAVGQFPGKKSRALNLRGLLSEDLGRYEIAAMDYAEAAKVAAAEGDRSEQFIAMNNAAASLLKRGMAREGYQAFLGVLRQSEQWANPLMVASTHNNLGQALSQLESYAAARAEFRKALVAKINSHDSFGEVTAALGLGRCEKELGNPEAAKAFFSLALIPALESQDAGLIAQVHLDLSDLEGKDGNLEGELQSLRWARDLTRDEGEPVLQALLVRQIALMLKRAGRIDEAIAECRALLEDRSAGCEVRAAQFVSEEYARLLGSRAETWLEAVAVLLERLKAAEKEMDETLIDARLAEITGEIRPIYGTLLELLSAPWARRIDGHAPAAFGFDLHESAKARTLLAHLADSAALPPPADIAPELRQMESALLANERKYQDERALSERERYEALGKVRAQLKDCWERMRAFAPDYVRTRSAEPYVFEEILATLRATTTGNTALVSFFTESGATSCFVVRADRDEPIMLPLPLREADLKQAARQVQRTFNGAPEEFPPYPPIRGDMPFKRKLDFLEPLSAAIAPLLESLKGVELVCVAPHGPLHAIPLHALALPDGQYLAERYAVIYTPSLSVAASKLRQATAAPPFGQTKYRAFVAGVSSADDAHPEYFEGDAGLFDAAHWDLRTAMGVQGAGRDTIIAGLHGNRVVHISCHAFFDPRNPLRSGLVLTDGRAKAPRDLSRLSFMQRQSYLVTVRDLMRIDLDAELVTLSACSTGLQREANAGDELEGFARSLLRAGAGSALLALWNVDQSSSHELLSQFYRNWSRGGMPKWKALQAAQRQFIATGGNLGHPYHWAPFSLIGSWEPA
jgi:tetratricopeptide (TPR) repeat protein